MSRITTDDVEERSERLLQEFGIHWNNPLIKQLPQDTAFCGWVLQKVAALQLIVEEQEEKIRILEL